MRDGTCARVLRDLKKLGLHVELVGGRPVLCGPSAKATPAILDALRRHRDEIIRSLTPPDAVDFLLPAGVVLCQSLCRPAAAPPHIPYGAVCWRLPGGLWQPLKDLPRAWNLKPLKRRRRKTLTEEQEP